MAKEINESILRDAQYRKGLSIAFFNATNSAIALVDIKLRPDEDEKPLLEKVIRIRDFFLEEHKNYYATIIANVGANYKAEDAIQKLKATNSKSELHVVWVSLSEDERRDGEIIKACQELVKKYETIQRD